jgi:hypothetical protein
MAMVLSAVIGIAVGMTAAGAEDFSTRCRGDEYRQFDFWIGSWQVQNANGDLVGHNDIRRAAGGCALLESWRGADGGEGISINSYDAETRLWTQRWVGSGVTLWLEGGIEEGRMVLASPEPRDSPQGPVLDRIIWSELEDGRVLQLWEVSSDGGISWRTIFKGFYSPAAATHFGSGALAGSGGAV